MKRFTGKARRKTPTKQEPPHYSTDPKDLLDGFTVGSMSVPYVPPTKEEERPTSPVLLKKGKKQKHSKAAKDRSLRDSPLVARQISLAVAAAKKLDSNEVQELHSVVNVPSSPLMIKRRNWASSERMMRSCSVDALNEIGDREPVSTTSHVTPEVQMRRCSTESKDLPIPPGYTRVVSYATAIRRPIKQHRPNSSFHGEIRHEAKFLNTFASQTDPVSRPQRALHEPKSVEHLLEALQSPGVDVNLRDEVTGNAPIHSIIGRKKKDRVELLLALLINSNVDITVQNRRNMTPLHSAIEAGCEMCAKATIVFGADINKQGCNQFTPLDLVINSGNLPSIESILLELGAVGSTQKLAECRKEKKIPRLFSFAEKMRPPKRAVRLKQNDKISEYINSKGVKRLYNELDISVMRRLSISATIGGADDAFALVLQQRELALYNRTQPKPKKKSTGTAYGLRGGSRMLFLDGGGIKGLVQLEVLMQLEERTQCKITDLFDWIVGTSTGGVIALAMVYGKKSLYDLRQLYFLLKNRIFMKSRYGYGYNSDTLEEILKEYLTSDIKMSDVRHPKVLIAAVNKATTNLELHFFNNCLDDEYTDYPVWKVARYTSAAPMFFTEFEDYVDGGVICNNPTDYGLTAIQDYCRLTENNIPIAVVVSIGTGVYPAEKIGIVDAQDALFFGKQWLKPGKLIKQTQNLLSLLSTALVESEMVAKNSRSRCKEQDIPFFRFSPKFSEIIASGETDNEKLFNMVISTKLELKQREKEMNELINIFHAIAESSKDLDQETIQEEEEVKVHPDSEEAELDERQDDVSKEDKEFATVDRVRSKEEELDSQAEVPDDVFVSEQGLENEELEPADTPADFKEEDEAIKLLAESIKEENKSALCPNQEEFADNFLFNSITSALDSKEGENILSHYSTSSSNSPSSVSPENETPDDSGSPDSAAATAATPTNTHTPVHRTRNLSGEQVVVFKGPVQKTPLAHNRSLSGNQLWEQKGLAQDPDVSKPRSQHAPVRHTRSHGSNMNKNQVLGFQAAAHPTVTPTAPGGGGANRNRPLQAKDSKESLYRQHRTASKPPPEESHQEQAHYKQETLV